MMSCVHVLCVCCSDSKFCPGHSLHTIGALRHMDDNTLFVRTWQGSDCRNHAPFSARRTEVRTLQDRRTFTDGGGFHHHDQRCREIAQ